MAELLGIKVITHGLWHAGSYDPADFLGRLIGNAPWVRHAERSMFESFDHNYFATEFHIRMFGKSHKVGNVQDKIVQTGWPMEYMKDTPKIQI